MIIPNYLEQLIHSGKAKAKVLSTGLYMQSVLKVPANSYVVIYGYYFRPYVPNYGDIYDTAAGTTPIFDARQSVQYVLFKSNNDFYPFAHYGQLESNGRAASFSSPAGVNQVRFTPNVPHQERSTYIVSNSDVGIAFSFINQVGVAFSNANIPIDTQTLPAQLQYGGENINISASGYFDPVLASNFYPLNQPYSTYAGLPEANQVTYQLWPRPSSGTIPNPGTATDAFYNAKFPLITVMYVQVNEQMPLNLQ